ncbi:receptor-type guanylate cyclase Gyc76C-like [Octopus bimaculoides]|nr:receptor-type guanylate cyclase Gyc76C-like [Octopus bimaculoides]
MSAGWCMGATVKILLVLCCFVFRGDSISDTIIRGNTKFHTMETSPSENKTVIYFSYMAASESQEYQREKQARLISGALSYAVSKINNDSNLLPNHTLAFKWSDTLSDELEVLRQMCHSWTDEVYAFFGPETYCGVAARLAAAWNTPMISYKCATHEVSNKTIYPTFARTFPPANQVTKFIVSLLKHHNWTQYSLVVGSSNRMMDIKSKLVQLSTEYNLSIINITTYKEPYIPIVGNSEIPGIVNNTYPHTRIYVFLGDQNGIVDFMCNLYDMGVLDGGKYIVIYIDHMPYNKNGSLKYFKKAMDNPTDNLNCGAAARSLLVMAPQPPSNRNYKHFEKMVNEYNEKAPFNFPDPFAAGKKVPLFAAHLYDAVYLYAECIHNMLLENLNIRNGTDVINRIRNKRFQSIQGFQCLIDENGDALGNYSLLAWKEDYSPNREANFSMDPVGSFIIDNHKSLPVSQLRFL